MFKFLVLTLGIISCQAYAEDTVIVNDHDTSAIKDCWQKNSDDDTDINVIKSCLRQEYNLVDTQLNKAYGEAYRYIEQVPRTGAKKLDTEQLNLLKKSGNDSNLLIVFYVQIMPDDLVMQLHR
ncbi:lysozyme inhibitor LprI family protein, partial [Shigella flexneri]|uniref:lysozyme inhibitor LprI family protein n=5 Tax=Shigella flexneri TaxID=623 RepID=UPI003CEE07EE